MDPLISALVVCLGLTKFEAANGLILRDHMIARCEVVRTAEGRRRGRPWLNATIDCKCKELPR